MKNETEKISLSYCLSSEGCRNASDFARKGREAKRTLIKMLAKEIWNRRLAKMDVDFHPEEKIIIAKVKVNILKEEEDG